MGWTKNWPTERGYYWFYGWCWRSMKGESELHLVTVHLDYHKKPVYVTNGHFIFIEEGADGLWQPATLPELPESQITEGG